MKSIVYYFSGTGNSLYVARAIISKLDGCNIYPIAAAMRGDGTVKTGEKSIGIVTPLYFGGLPRIVAEFIRKTDFSSADYIFLIVTAGHNAGTAVSETEKILSKKGKKLSYGNYLVMPDNYMPMYNLNPSMVEKSLSELRPKLENVIKDLAEMKKGLFEKTYFSGPLIKFWHRKWVVSVQSKDERYSVTDKCSSCKICGQVCPVENIKLVNGKPVWQHHCEQCLACMQFCPEDAIHYMGKKKNNTHYHHPDIKLADIISQKRGTNDKMP